MGLQCIDGKWYIYYNGASHQTKLDYNTLDLSVFTAVMMNILEKAKGAYKRNLRWQVVPDLFAPAPIAPNWSEWSLKRTLDEDYDGDKNAYVWAIYQKCKVFPLISTDMSHIRKIKTEYWTKTPADYYPGDDIHPGYWNDFEDYPLRLTSWEVEISTARFETLKMMVSDIDDLSDAGGAIILLEFLSEDDGKFETATITDV
jgi:hypothetical protein